MEERTTKEKYNTRVGYVMHMGNDLVDLDAIWRSPAVESPCYTTKKLMQHDIYMPQPLSLQLIEKINSRSILNTNAVDFVE